MVQVVHIKMSDSLENNSETPIHYIPCKVHFDGNANVSKYFLHSTDKGGHSTDKGKQYEASFRGYPLKGKTVGLPEGYKGLILEEKIQRSDDQHRTLHVSKTFNELIYWNWDKIPSKNDVFLAAMDWIDIASAVSSPPQN